MRLTTKGRYAVTAMLDLALHFQGRPVALAEIAERQNLSLAYLEQLFARLRRVGLVKSCRGPGGGYLLARALHEISVSEILNGAEELVEVTRCSGAGDCQGGKPCISHELWSALDQHLKQFLEQVSLADLVARQKLQQLGERWPDMTPAWTGGVGAAMVCAPK